MPPAMAHPALNESFEEFYVRWTAIQAEQLQELKAALECDMKEEELANLVCKVKEHYRAYYVAKDSAAHQNILQMMSPSWKSPLENAFLWLGGWRPTMVFQLAYAEVGHQVEVELANLLNGIDTPSMAALSSEQFARIDDLQRKTQQREEELSHRMAILQQEMADSPLATLAQMEATIEGNSQKFNERQGTESDTVSAMKEKLKSLENLVIDADTLRYATLDEMLTGVLTVYQSAQYLAAAGQLHLCIRRIGKIF